MNSTPEKFQVLRYDTPHTSDQQETTDIVWSCWQSNAFSLEVSKVDCITEGWSFEDVKDAAYFEWFLFVPRQLAVQQHQEKFCKMLESAKTKTISLFSLGNFYEGHKIYVVSKPQIRLVCKHPGAKDKKHDIAFFKGVFDKLLIERKNATNFVSAIGLGGISNSDESGTQKDHACNGDTYFSWPSAKCAEDLEESTCPAYA
jgi:hypothetical protein